MKNMWVIWLVLLAILSFGNAFLMFSLPPWFSPFAGMLVAVAIPFFGAMIGLSGTLRKG